MIRFLLRFIGMWTLAAAFIFLVYDGTKSIASNALFMTRVKDVWGSVHQSSMISLQPKLEGIAHFLWDPAMTTFLDAPVTVVLVIVGIILLILGRKKRPLIGYGRD
ncbi:MAG: hypothetical protein ACXWJ8_10955 [Xanthobacteraceae bacterium]